MQKRHNATPVTTATCWQVGDIVSGCLLFEPMIRLRRRGTHQVEHCPSLRSHPQFDRPVGGGCALRAGDVCLQRWAAAARVQFGRGRARVAAEDDLLCHPKRPSPGCWPSGGSLWLARGGHPHEIHLGSPRASTVLVGMLAREGR